MYHSIHTAVREAYQSSDWPKDCQNQSPCVSESYMIMNLGYMQHTEALYSKEDEGNRNTSSDLQFDDDDDDEESSSIIDTDDDATTKLEVAAKTDAVPSWMQSNLADVSSSLSKEDVPLFFHIPKAAGTAIQNLYWCMGLTLANEVGANEKFAHNKDTKMLEFQPFHSLDYHVVNVDTTSRNGILRAKNMGLVSSTDPAVDVVVSGEINYSAQNLFDEGHKGRVVYTSL